MVVVVSMVGVHRLTIGFGLITLLWLLQLVAASSQLDNRQRRQPSHRPFTNHLSTRYASHPPRSNFERESLAAYDRSPSTPRAWPATLSKRGVPGMAGDIEWMGFYGSLLAVPTMLSILGIVTNYNLEKSYFNSQLNAQYYKQTREMLRAHTTKLIQDQEQKFAAAGVKWNGMMYDASGHVRGGARLPEWNGRVVAGPVTQTQTQMQMQTQASGVGGGGAGGAGGAGVGRATAEGAGRPGGTNASNGAEGAGTGPGGTDGGATSTVGAGEAGSQGGAAGPGPGSPARGAGGAGNEAAGSGSTQTSEPGQGQLSGARDRGGERGSDATGDAGGGQANATDSDADDGDDGDEGER